MRIAVAASLIPCPSALAVSRTAAVALLFFLPLPAAAGSRQFRVFLGLADLLDQRVPHNIAGIEGDKADAVDMF